MRLDQEIEILLGRADPAHGFDFTQPQLAEQLQALVQSRASQSERHAKRHPWTARRVVAISAFTALTIGGVVTAAAVTRHQDARGVETESVIVQIMDSECSVPVEITARQAKNSRDLSAEAARLSGRQWDLGSDGPMDASTEKSTHAPTLTSSERAAVREQVAAALRESDLEVLAIRVFSTRACP